MNLAIIAASLVVMRPCFAYIYGLIFGRREPTMYSHSLGYLSSDRTSKVQDNKITKTVDIRLSSRSISQERILPDIVPESLTRSQTELLSRALREDSRSDLPHVVYA